MPIEVEPDLKFCSKPYQDYAIFSSAVHAGKMVVFEQIPAVVQLLSHTQQLLRTTFSPSDPVDAEHHTDPQPFRQACDDVQKAFQNDPIVKQLWNEVFAVLGLPLDQTYVDKAGLRIFASQPSHHGQRLSATPVHRDSWGSNILSQINWWMPLYPVNEHNTLTFYPRHWDKKIKNTSGKWAYENYKSEQIATELSKNIEYPTAPYATQKLDESEAFALVINPGDIVAFSGAHLHGGKPNKSPYTRISLETRTVVLDDIAHQRVSPNIDGAYLNQHPKWFRHALTGKPLKLETPV